MIISAAANLFAGEDIERECERERSMFESGAERYRKLVESAINRGEGSSLAPSQQLAKMWFPPLQQAIRDTVKATKAGDYLQGATIWGPMLVLLDPATAAAITIDACLNRLTRDDNLLRTHLAYAIGRDFLAQLNYEHLRDYDREYLRANKDIPFEERPPRKSGYFALAGKYKKLDGRIINWWANKTLDNPQTERRVLLHIGGLLLGLLLDTAIVYPKGKDGEGEPAIETYKGTMNGKPALIIRLTDAAMTLLEDGHRQRMKYRPRFGAMVCHPLRWSRESTGGYYRLRSSPIAKARPEQTKALRESDMTTPYEGLAALDGAPWRVNRFVLDTMQQIVDEGGGELLIPRMQNIPMPPPVASTDPEKIKANRLARKIVYGENITLQGQRELFLNVLSEAYRDRDEARLYFPSQFDFRGRGYPLASYLHPQGDDICRGLLEYADTVSLGSGGKRALQIHAANVFGMDKLEFDDRVAFIEASMGNIEAVVDDPVGNRWWTTGDPKSRWQFLAACFALVDDEAGMRLPTSWDATCSGMQHYSAMGLDPAGAESVNLLDTGARQDLYQRVADAVIEAGKPADLLDQVDRALVKQPTMTKLYGVTFMGASNQIAGVLQSRGWTRQEARVAARALYPQIMEAVRTACPAAMRVMDWLGEVARAVTETGKPIRWTSPTGFPVVQAYRKHSYRKLQTISGEITFREVPDESLPIRRDKQVASFAPNFVHSVDGAHMLLTAIAAADAGIPFGHRHDCYLFHAGNAERGNRITREQFVLMHENDLLGALHMELSEYAGVDLPAPPERGDFDLSLVLDSPYFFS